VRAVVVDASAVAEVILRTERARLFRATIEDADVVLHIPARDVELAAVLRRALFLRRIDEDRAWQAWHDYVDLQLIRHGHTTLMERALELRRNFTTYDATYIALAERLEAELLTGDEPLARTTRSHTDLTVLPARPA
jgi:predicted nucleic acid-binding protein